MEPLAGYFPMPEEGAIGMAFAHPLPVDQGS